MASCSGNCTGLSWCSCGTGCTSGSACTGCTGGCSSSCTGCSGSCSGGCTSCSGSCSGGCSSCSGGCSGCSGSCSGGCYGCSGSCSGGCSSCSGSCSGNCAGTCLGDCNNACNTASAAGVIANIGSNIMNKGFLSTNDFVELRNAVRTELQRRNKAVPADAYSVNPAQGINVLVEHASKVYNNVYAMDASKDFRARAAQGRIITKDDIDDTIDYVKILMAQSVK